MMRWALLMALVLTAALAATAQEQSSPPPGTAAPTQPTAEQQGDQKPKKKGLARVKEKLSDLLPSCVHIENSRCVDVPPPQSDPAPDAQEASQKNDREGQDSSDQPKAQQKPRGPGKNQPTPRSDAPSHDGEFSSSRDTMIDLSPPPGDAKNHPDSSAEPDSEVAEFHKWDPHKAAKNIEVGDYYYHEKNYPAAISRYEEALEFKPNDALATFRLAQAEEKLEQVGEARRHYEAYLRILPRGPYAGEARSALARLKNAK